MNFLLFLKFFLILFSQSAKADSDRIAVSYENQYFYLRPKNSAELFSKLEIKLYGSKKISDSFSFKYDTTLNYVHLTKQDEKKVLVIPTQLGFFGGGSIFDYQLGFWQYTPEGTDINNLFDVIHGKDFRQPFSSENLSSFGILIGASFDFISWKLFYIPKNSKSILPDTQSPWWPRTDALPVQNANGTFLIPDNISYKYRDDFEFKKPFDNNFGSTIKLTFDVFDLHLLYYSGANQTPQIFPNFNIDVISISPLVGVVRPPVELDTTWFKSEHIGAGVSTVLDPVILKAFCKNQRNFNQETNETSACNGVVESSFNISRSTLRYFLQVNRLWKKNQSASELETLLGFFEKSVALGFLIDLNPENILSGAAIYNEKNPSYLVSLRYEKKWTDSFRTTGTFNVITAQDGTLAKAYDQTDNLSLKLAYDF